MHVFFGWCQSSSFSKPSVHAEERMTSFIKTPRAAEQCRASEWLLHSMKAEHKEKHTCSGEFACQPRYLCWLLKHRLCNILSILKIGIFNGYPHPHMRSAYIFTTMFMWDQADNKASHIREFLTYREILMNFTKLKPIINQWYRSRF